MTLFSKENARLLGDLPYLARFTAISGRGNSLPFAECVTLNNLAMGRVLNRLQKKMLAQLSTLV
jgi:hypothetical protein